MFCHETRCHIFLSIFQPPPSAVMEQWLSHETEILGAILSREADELITKECAGKCGLLATVRCHECGEAEPMCEGCTVHAHQRLYFHRVERWNGDFFESVDLCELGHIVYLGHRNHPCPNIPKKQAPNKFIFVHTNGVHHGRVQYCYCSKLSPSRKPRYLQLIRSGLWPSTITSPATVFSEAFMKLWHLDWNISHKSSQDFFRVFARLTCNYDLASVDVCTLNYV